MVLSVWLSGAMWRMNCLTQILVREKRVRCPSVVANEVVNIFTIISSYFLLWIPYMFLIIHETCCNNSKEPHYSFTVSCLIKVCTCALGLHVSSIFFTYGYVNIEAQTFSFVELLITAKIYFDQLN